jgi:serine phosphatase RsbU (regulator of sigma subunit)
LNGLYLIFGGVFVIFLKIIGDSFFYLFGDIYSEIAVSWKILFSLIFLFFVALFFIKNYLDSEKDTSETTSDKYFSEIIRIIFLTLGLLFVNIFVPEEIENYGEIPNYTYFLYIELVSIYSAILGMIIINFLYKWLLFRKHKRTKLYIKILAYSLFILLLFEIPFHYEHVSAEELAGVPVIIVFSIILVVAILLIIFMVTKRNNWIAILPKKKKLKLLLLYFILLIISIIFMGITIDQQGEGKFSMAVQFTFGADTLLFMSFYCLIPYIARLMLSVIVALPTTDIVERTTSEVSSLTYLNRVVSKTFDMNELIHTLTELSLQTCRGIASWTELYKKDGTIEIGSTQYLTEEHIQSLDSDGNLHSYLQKLGKPILIDSIFDSIELSMLNWSVLPLAKSMIAVPLFAGEDRIGTLVILHPEIYGLELEDLKVMEAFGDNINLALENAKLVKDSIEKERYKRELFLAREMEEKLLPMKLPEIEGYSIAAFSIPATEVGGDYYDIVTLKTGKKCLLIGDVSGKGMSSAFYMAQLKGVVMALAPESSSPSDLLSKINHTLFGNIERQMYITLSAISINDSQGNISFSRAGHMPVFIKINEEIKTFQPNGIGIALAGSKLFNRNIEEVNIELSKASACIMFTDGINELRNSVNSEFGFDSLKQILKTSVYNSRAESLIIEIKNKIESFLGDNIPHDDMTVVLLVYHGNDVGKDEIN